MLRQDGREGDVALASDGSLEGLAMPPPVATRTGQAEPDGFSRKSEPAAPLAAPLSDIRIKAATAITFRVKAGQYIQIMDIDGRQCSDFLAFDAALLDRGHRMRARRHRDAHADGPLPIRGPGLHSKFYDQRMRPMRRGGAGHLRPARHLRPCLHDEILRRHGLSGP